MNEEINIQGSENPLGGQEIIEQALKSRKKTISQIRDMENKYQQMTQIKQFTNSRLGLAIICTVIIVIILIIANPPITQKSKNVEFEVQKQDSLKILIFGVIVFLLIMILPVILSKKKNEK